MARMFPLSLEHGEVQSRVEPKLFKLFEDNLDNEYTVFHGVSWYLPKIEAQDTGNNGEADFVIIHPKKGIIVVEAKTGKLKHSPTTNKWEIEGSGQRKKESPLGQAQKNRYALEKAIRKAFKDSPQKLPEIKFCFAVALPDYSYDPVFEPVNLPKSLFLDSEACSDVSAWVDGVYSFYSGNQSQSLGDWVDAIVEVLVGSNNFSSTLKSQMALMQKTIDSLTTEQYKIIDWLRNNNRAKIAGCAGSGKTLVAVEKAIRLSRLGNRTLLLCHSYYLAKNLRFMTKDTDIYVEDFCSWIERITGKNTSDGDKLLRHHKFNMQPMKWRDTGGNLVLLGKTDSVFALLAFFSSENWAKDIPQPKKVRISANIKSTDREQIKLSTVASFKGLESDGVILYINSPRNDLANLYVGVSRAKIVLYVVGWHDALSYLSDECCF